MLKIVNAEEAAKRTLQVDLGEGDDRRNITLELKAGTYAVVCFLSDREGGKSHAEKGLIEEPTIE